MSNDYYNNTESLSEGTRARATEVEAKFDEVEAAFDLLPDRDDFRRGTVSYGVATGSSNAYILSLTNVTALTDGLQIVFKANHTNTGASTINVSSLGVKSLRQLDGTVLVAGDIIADQIHSFRYNSTSGYFEMERLAAGNVSDLETVAGIASNVSTVAGIDSEVTTVAGIDSNVTTVAGISDDVTTVAGIYEEIETVADPWEVKDTDYTASSRDSLVVGTNVTITMPASPSSGDWVEFACGGDWATTNSTVGRNGENIMGSAEDLTLDQNAGFGLVYKAATQGWAIY